MIDSIEGDPARFVRRGRGRNPWRRDRFSRVREAETDFNEIPSRYPNVQYVALGERRVGGLRTGEPAIVIYVSKKQDVEAGDTLPRTWPVRIGKRISHVQIDVVELPSQPRALGLRSGHLIRSGDNEYGICGLTFVRDSTSYMITNAHVVENVSTRSVYGEPAALDPPSAQYLPLGPVIYCSPFPDNVSTAEDLAIVRVDHVPVDAMGMVNEASPIGLFGDLQQGGNFWYSVNGARFQCRFPEYILSDVPVLVDGRTVAYAGCWKLQMTVGGSAPGHSGSLLCRGSGSNIEACGLVFGGSVPSWIYVFPISVVMNRVDTILG